jgi:hypothetical protein
VPGAAIDGEDIKEPEITVGSCRLLNHGKPHGKTELRKTSYAREQRHPEHGTI